MANRLRRLQRTLAALQNLELIERSRFAEADRSVEACLQEQHELLESLSGESVFQGRFIDIMSKRIGRLVKQEQMLKAARAEAAERLSQAALRARATDGLLTDAKIEHGRMTDRAELNQVLEVAVAALAQGRGKSTVLP